MADTIKIDTSRDWAKFPEADQFLFQNVSEHEIRVAVSTEGPPVIDGHILMRGESTNRISDGDHWYRSNEIAAANFTPADLRPPPPPPEA